MATRYDAVVAGHICLDVIPDLSAVAGQTLETVLSPGRLTEVGRASLSTGGAVSNTGLALNKLGIPTRLMGKVGDDVLGQAVQQIVAAHAPQAGGMIVDKRTSSSYTIIINFPGVDRIFLHYPGANDTFCAADVDYSLLAQARLFHFGYPPIMRMMYQDDGAELVAIFRRAREAGVTTSLDMALPDPSSPAGRADWVRILTRVLPLVDIFLPSIEEILYMLRRETYDRLMQKAGKGSLIELVTPDLLSGLGRQVLDMGVKIVVLKLGERGLYLRTASRAALEQLGRGRLYHPAEWADKELWAPCFLVNVVGTTGAGDATIAGFLGAFLRHMSPEQAATMAVAVGACNVEAADALSGIRSWEETLARIAGDWDRRPMVVDAPGWQYDDETRLWEAKRASPGGTEG